MRDYKFESTEIYPGLVAVRNGSNVIGYVNLHPFENQYFYFIKDFVSEFFDNELDAINELCKHFLMVKLDKQFDDKGLLNNEKYVRR